MIAMEFILEVNYELVSTNSFVRWLIRHIRHGVVITLTTGKRIEITRQSKTSCCSYDGDLTKAEEEEYHQILLWL